MEQIESSIKPIPFAGEAVYAKLSDLTYFEGLKEMFSSDKLQEKGVDIDWNKVTFTTDSVTIPTTMAQISLRICDRDPFKTIKFELGGIPVEANLWIQISPVDAVRSKMKLTVRYDIPFYLKPMLKGKLSHLPEGLERLGDMLAAISY